ncbi:lysophospholipid acyltransferase family protein [Marilutibacter alkalisoli]|uniref:1-acyl-sn-glycerol-3-phosphate acyltransferase n=1 Tax=Marilutibacter alkalisoli TaxID=2591633 RepID=A0A514BVM7_9GAMM|nr:lysophospholipid acyltransferase family protein [Lysobacter alkalisoli]QDH71444.1 1-acyl-sn-glycerol-3-phosphate acyltransferase [Lysobacter alkalisoli]
MNASPPHGVAGTRSAWPARAFRYLYRIPLLLLHLAVSLPVVLVLISLPTHRLHWGGEPLDHRAVRAWSGGLMRIFGFRMRRVGTPLPGAAMFVANHVSWIDITALHSQRMMGFVAKREISNWPVVGWLAGRAGTIFHHRGSTESLGGVLHEMLARLRNGQSVGVFPEGGTRGGREIGPFHARIFLAAVEAGVPVQPVALRYGEHGNAQVTVAFAPRESFMANFLRLLGEPARPGEVIFLEPIPHGAEDGRRRIAELARQRIIGAMQY